MSIRRQSQESIIRKSSPSFEAATATTSGLVVAGASGQSVSLMRVENLNATGATQILTRGNETVQHVLSRASTDAVAPIVSFTKSRGTIGSGTAAASGDSIGSIFFNIYDGAADRNSALIRATVDGGVASSDSPGRLEFHTTADGSATLTERMRIDNAGLITGTGTSLGAWTSWTPTVTAQTGTFTTIATAYARYCQVGKIVHCRLEINITTNGTAAGDVRFTLPITQSGTGRNNGVGREHAVTGDALIVQTISTTQAIILEEDNTYPGGNGHLLNLNLTYEAA
jgi:hypothetical protein